MLPRHGHGGVCASLHSCRTFCRDGFYAHIYSVQVHPRLEKACLDDFCRDAVSIACNCCLGLDLPIELVCPSGVWSMGLPWLLLRR